MSQTITPERTMTAEEFWDYCVGRDERLELVDGKVVEMSPVGPTHGRVDVKLMHRLEGFLEKHPLGQLYLNTGFILRRDADVTRGPDEAFVREERIATNPPPERGF